MIIKTGLIAGQEIGIYALMERSDLSRMAPCLIAPLRPLIEHISNMKGEDRALSGAEPFMWPD